MACLQECMHLFFLVHRGGYVYLNTCNPSFRLLMRKCRCCIKTVSRCSKLLIGSNWKEELKMMINFCMGFGGCVKRKSYFNIWNIPYANEMQYSFDGECCWNGRGVTYMLFIVLVWNIDWGWCAPHTLHTWQKVFLVSYEKDGTLSVNVKLIA